MVPESGRYILNAKNATDACQYLNVSIATTAQMERALQLGLQTCKFGWIDGHVAVIPRITRDPKCGKNKTGLVTWSPAAEKLFCAYCFNATDLENDLSTTSDIPVTSKSTAATMASVHTLTAATSLYRQNVNSTFSTKSTKKASKPNPHTAVVGPWVKSARSPWLSSTSGALTSTSIATLSSSPLSVTPLNSVAFRFFSEASGRPSTSSDSSGSVHTTTTNYTSVLFKSVNSTAVSLGVVPTAMIVLVMILLILTTAGALWYYNLKRRVFPFWPRGQQKDDTETEMWKQTDSEMDLHSHRGGEEEDTDKKYCSNGTLCAYPDIQTNSAQ
ncbi:lymphatic vessel endothelial hyaluronic acid receptor 1-like [Lampris incognitus]|uniref:lymphatic vessel endothelial hyaluronic acid receptor 1-like n=1 Tax=Lampris incognitus TaxID=2546036 RepID=UPI0024B52EDD|nr:lymphatic vessel endothelial hyaluronic acid receptor 1-like [Lampris incognitus]